MFEHKEIAKSIYEGSYKKLLDNIPTLLVTLGKREEYQPRQKLTLIWVNKFSSEKNGMLIFQETNKN